ncbi:hypothetical protein EDB83DRAFT_862176 [Lactarius deliciosus]|nr:hypothetical protein EDB83DRAFT_862176 [Lactarius deliciosus]
MCLQMLSDPLPSTMRPEERGSLSAPRRAAIVSLFSLFAVTVYLVSTCYGGAFGVVSLPDVGDSYSSPTIEKAQESKLVLVQHRDIQSHKCLRRIPIWPVEIVRLSSIALPFAQFFPSRFRWFEYSRNCTGIIEPSTFSNPVPEGTRNGLFAMTATEVFVQYTCDRMPTCRKPGLQDEGGKQRQRDSVDDQPDSPPVPNKCPIPGTGSAELPLGDRPLEGHLAWQGGPWPCDDLPFTGSSRRMKTWKTHGLSFVYNNSLIHSMSKEVYCTCQCNDRQASVT